MRNKEDRGKFTLTTSGTQVITLGTKETEPTEPTLPILESRNNDSGPNTDIWNLSGGFQQIRMVLTEKSHF